MHRTSVFRAFSSLKGIRQRLTCSRVSLYTDRSCNLSLCCHVGPAISRQTYGHNSETPAIITTRQIQKLQSTKSTVNGTVSYLSTMSSRKDEIMAREAASSSVEGTPVTSLIASTAQQPKQFYRRELPDTGVSFRSARGVQLFTEALAAGHMACYFGLAAQFCTQDEPAFCGLTTLVMALNTLEVDPRRLWKAPWRWYHENMLDCCVPLEITKKIGITFDQFLCLAQCNALDVRSTRADNSTTAEHFRQTVQRCTSSDQQVLVASYSRELLNQTGIGHFSPIGGYHPGEDMVLVMDTARFKYPPHWVKLPLLFQAMQICDTATGLPRGYAVLSRATHAITKPFVFKLAEPLCVTGPVPPAGAEAALLPCLTSWRAWLASPCPPQLESSAVWQLAITQFTQRMRSFAAELLITQLHFACDDNASDMADHRCAVQQVLAGLEATPLYSAILSTQTSRGESHDASRGQLYSPGAEAQSISENIAPSLKIEKGPIVIGSVQEAMVISSTGCAACQEPLPEDSSVQSRDSVHTCGKKRKHDETLSDDSVKTGPVDDKVQESSCQQCGLIMYLQDTHVLSMLLLSWPYPTHSTYANSPTSPANTMHVGPSMQKTPFNPNTIEQMANKEPEIDTADRFTCENTPADYVAQNKSFRHHSDSAFSDSIKPQSASVTFAQMLHTLREAQLQGTNSLFVNEVTQLKLQLSHVLKYKAACHNCSCK